MSLFREDWIFIHQGSFASCTILSLYRYMFGITFWKTVAQFLKYNNRFALCNLILLSSLCLKESIFMQAFANELDLILIEAS